MTSPSSAFSELRALLQVSTPSWTDFADALASTLDEMNPEHIERFQAQYQSYLEAELDEKFEDWMRVLSFDSYIEGAHPLHIALARHVEINYERDTFIKPYFATCKKVMKTHPLTHITALSIDNLGTRNALNFIKLLATQDFANLKTFGFSFEWQTRVTQRSQHAQRYDALLAFPNPKTLTTLAIKWNASLRLESEPMLLEALREHMPRYQWLEDFSIGEEFEDSASFTHVLDIIPPTVTRLSLNVNREEEHVEWISHPVFKRLELMRLGSVARTKASMLRKHDILTTIPVVDLSWDSHEHPWDSPPTLLHHTLELATAHAQDIDPSQLLVDTLDLGATEPLNTEALHALLIDEQGSHRTFPLLTSLRLAGINSDSFALLMKQGQQCFPHIKSLDLPYAKALQNSALDWSDVAPWDSLETLSMSAHDDSSGQLIEGLWKYADKVLFPQVHTLELSDFDMATYEQVAHTALARFPALHTLGRFKPRYDPYGAGPLPSIVEMMAQTDFLMRLPNIIFCIYEGIGSYTSKEHVSPWLSLLHNDKIPLPLRRYILNQVFAQPTKGDLVEHIAPSMGVILPKSGSKPVLIKRLLASLPKNLRTKHSKRFTSGFQTIKLHKK